MKGNLTSDDFMDIVADVKELGANAQDYTDDINQAVTDIQYYLDNIKDADITETETLNKLLISAFSKINFKLQCLWSKLSLITSIFLDCADGNGDMEALYEKALKLEPSKIDEKCNENTTYFTYEELKNVTEEAMILSKKQTVCIRNNQEKLDLACRDWYDDVTVSESAVNVGVTEDDINYFIALCLPGDVTSTVSDAICSSKQEKLELNEAIREYYKYNSTQVTSTYDLCPLTEAQIEAICGLKDDGYSLDHVVGEYSRYPIENVTQAYDGCVQKAEVTPADGTQICLLHGAGIPFDSPTGLWDLYLDRYGQTLIEEYIAENCSADSEGDAEEKITEFPDKTNSMEREDQKRR